MTDAPAITEFQGKHRFLSNFYEMSVPMEYRGLSCPTSEHAFAMAKTDDVQKRKDIAAASTPGIAKRMGRRVTLIRYWDELRDQRMAEIVSIKFDQPDLTDLLLSTGDAELVEGNRWGDAYWGVDLRTGHGENRLGKILMAERAHQRAMVEPGLVPDPTATDTEQEEQP